VPCQISLSGLPKGLRGMLLIRSTSEGEKMDLSRGKFHTPDSGIIRELTLASTSRPLTGERS
jgi:hypothetical protein